MARRGSELKVGDRVGYARSFLSVCSSYEVASARGRITELQQIGGPQGTILATIQWENGADLPPRVNVANLARPGSVRFVD